MKLWSATLLDFRCREWDSELVVYDERSGDTHALDPLASAIVRSLQEQGRASLQELSARVSAALADSATYATEKSEDVVAEALAFLESLRLVASVEY